MPPRRSGEAAAQRRSGELLAPRRSGEVSVAGRAVPAPLPDPPWLADTLKNAPLPAPTPPAPEPVIDPREREAMSRNPRALFADLIGDADQTALLLDADGFVLAGAYVTSEGRDVAQEVGAELSGVSDEAQRAMRHLDLGDWQQIVV